ncbi:MAG: 5'-nucleotidase (lipoprotein e(P4) family) [Bacteroidia bacterium]|jgi:5'-nucleotidase (lipoprotein e(P4) family)
MRLTGLLILAFLWISCESEKASTEVKALAESDVDFDRQLVDQHVNAVLWFARSAEAKVLFEQAYDHAAIKLQNNLKSTKGSPAVILDLDETVLDNSPYEVERIEAGVPYGSDTWKEWTARGEAPILAGAMNFLNLADSLGVEIFYISNRKQVEMEGTLQNLIDLNVPNADTSHIFLRTSTSDKTERRARVLADHDVLVYLGDNLTDFSQSLADREISDLGMGAVNAISVDLKERFIMFPNPMYGEWEKAIYDNNYRISSEEKLAKRKEILFGK